MSLEGLEIKPIKICLDDLDEPNKYSTTRSFLYDLGNLLAYDPSPIDQAELSTNTNEHILMLAKEAMKGLYGEIKKLPLSSEESKKLCKLPEPKEQIPREKPLPMLKPQTKWEKFAQSKGMKKNKKDRNVWDEELRQWRPRYGYKSKTNDMKRLPIIEAKADELFAEDPFKKMEDDKKERIKKQNKQQLDNARKAASKGYVSEKVKLTAKLPEHGKGCPTARKGQEKQIQIASKLAGISTASMGKFDKKLKGEVADERTHVIRKRKLIGNNFNDEIQNLQKLAKRVVGEKSENKFDVNRAIGKLEAQRREERHSEKVSQEMNGKKINRRRKNKKK